MIKYALFFVRVQWNKIIKVNNLNNKILHPICFCISTNRLAPEYEWISHLYLLPSYWNLYCLLLSFIPIRRVFIEIKNKLQMEFKAEIYLKLT